MIPVLYDRLESNFATAGIGVLSECTRCEVTEEVNGTYELELDYPSTGEFYDRLLNIGGVVCVTHDHNGDVQPFDIYRYTAPVDGIVTFYCSHISYRLANAIKHPNTVTFSSPSALFSVLADNTSTLVEAIGTFTFTDNSGYTSGTFTTPTVYNIREAILDREQGDRFVSGSFLGVWSGEFVFDKTSVEFYKQRGQDRGVQIIHGKNISGIERDRDSGGIVSEVVPIWTNSETGVTTVYNPVISPNFDVYGLPWTTHTDEFMYGSDILYFRVADIRGAVYDISEQFETQPTATQAAQAARDYMSKNSTWRANDNIEIQFVDLYDSPEYADVREIEKFSIGDRVTVSFPELGVYAKGVEVMTGTYDALGERFTKMQLSTIRTTLAQLIIDTVRR